MKHNILMKHTNDYNSNIQKLADEVLSVPNKKSEDSSLDVSDYILLRSEVEQLQVRLNNALSENNKLIKENAKLKSDIKDLKRKQEHNARNAGRHRLEDTEKYKKFCTLYESGLPKTSIVASLRMSERSYYLYRKAYRNVKRAKVKR